MWSCSLFSLPLIFTLVAAGISHFLTAAIKFSCYSSNESGVLCFLSLALALSLLSTPIKTLKLSRKKESALLMLFFISKSPGGYVMYRRTRGYFNAKFHPGLHERVDVRIDDLLRTKISWIHRLPNFLTHGASLLNNLFADF